MATTAPERRSRVVEALGFWFITLVICAAAGLGSYRFGRNWIGDRLGGEVKSVLTSDELASRVNEEAFGGSDEADASDVPDEPPEKAIVEVESTPVTTGDRQRLRLGKERGTRDSATDDSASDEGDDEATPADSGEEEAEPEPSTPEAKPETEPATSSGAARTSEGGTREHVVRAGSFTKSGNADRLVDELRGKGYQPFVTETVVDGVTYHRVNVARYDEKEKALDLRGELRGEGYPAEISAE